MSLLGHFAFGRAGQAPGVLADGLEQRKAGVLGVGVGLDQGLGDQGGEHLERCGGHRFGGRRVEASAEHGEAADRGSPFFVQELVTPVQGSSERPMAGVKIAPAQVQGPERVGQALGDLSRRERSETSGRQLEGEGDALEAPANLAHRLLVRRAEGKARSCLGAALREQGERRHVGQRRQTKDMFFGQAHGLAAGGDDAQLGAGAQPSGNQLGARAEDVLAVVHDDQARCCAQAIEDGLFGVALTPIEDTQVTRHARGEQPLVAHGR